MPKLEPEMKSAIELGERMLCILQHRNLLSALYGGAHPCAGASD
jgi:hypothetical protein